MGKLIRLELCNFKSYKGHHTLLFGDSYFTSIIGPNGSGKSNSMDAISFVLGIKSSHLRSSHLRDLIYRGRVLKTSKINADGSAEDSLVPLNGYAGSDDEQATQSSTQRNDPHSAWVMAVYEDAAGDEVTWKRTITSQGQSEYRINNKVVNAKQYNDALEAEDILIKARNFLVFQGDVESIANQSPKDLTRLVEQISGSLEYKVDYDRLSVEAETALNDQNFKLNQRRVINAEIKQYTEQKQEADSYNKKAQERDDAIINHILWKLYHFQNVIDESSEEMQRHQDELQEHRRGVEQHEQLLEAARQEQAKVTREVTKADRNIKSAQNQLNDQQNKLIPVDEKINISRKNSDKHTKRATEISKERDAQSKSVDRLNRDLSVVNKAQTQWEEDWKKLAKKKGRQLKEADLQEYNHLKEDVNQRTADVQMKIDNLRRQQKTDEETVSNLKSKSEELDRQLAAFQAQLDDLRSKKETFTSDSKQLSQDIASTKKEYNEMVSDCRKNSQRHTELEEKLQSVLTKLVEADDGRFQSEKEIRSRDTLLAMKRIFPGIHGRVHELCKPKQKKYETAVSTVLGRHFDSIVVDTDRIAQDCISYLRDQRVGLATFIPIDTIQVKPFNSGLKSLHKKMRLAIDTVDYDRSVERAISFACGNAMVCDDMATAKYLCYEKKVEAKAVTLDGTIIHKGGLMTGGRGPNDKNTRKWDDKEVENLRVLKEKLLAEISNLPNSRQAATGEEALQSELSGLEQRLAQANDESKALDKNLESKKKEVKFVQQQLSEVKPKFKDQSQALETLIKRIQELQTQVSSVEDDVFAAFCQRLQYDNIRDYEAQQGSLQQEGAQKKLEFTMQRSKLENQLTFENQRLSSTNERIQRLEEEYRKLQSSIDLFEHEKAAIQEEIGKTERQITKLKDVADKQRELHAQKAEKVAEERRLLQNRNKDIEFVLKTITGLEAEVKRNASNRYALLRKCKIDEIKIPLSEESEPLDSLPIDDMLRGDENGDAMEVDQEEDTTLENLPVRDYGIEIDFSDLDEDLKEDSSATQENKLQKVIADLNTELSSLNPNMRAMERLNTAEERLRASDESFMAAREAARNARNSFEAVRKNRADLFNKAFNHISNQIGPVYKALTTSESYPLGGQAYLDTMGADDDTPFLGGLKYHAMPPLKRFRDMDALSGGEKTMAALALLFAVHSYSPSPFFVLDEVDAALDNANVAKVAKYIRDNAGPGMQFIVISLKAGLFQESQTLVGILRDQGANTSRAVTLDLRKYRPT